jgi:hypothetical protein
MNSERDPEWNLDLEVAAKLFRRLTHNPRGDSLSGCPGTTRAITQAEVFGGHTV